MRGQALCIIFSSPFGMMDDSPDDEFFDGVATLLHIAS